MLNGVCWPPWLSCVAGRASVHQAAPVLCPAAGQPLLPQLWASRSHRAHKCLRGLPEGHHTSPQQQPAGVNFAGLSDCWKCHDDILHDRQENSEMWTKWTVVYKKWWTLSQQPSALYGFCICVCVCVLSQKCSVIFFPFCILLGIMSILMLTRRQY